MRKIQLLLVIIFISCKSYLDREKSIHSDYFDFNYLKTYNEFVYKSKINSCADKEKYLTTNFKIRLPKNIKDWLISNPDFFYEYKQKQIIYIYTGYKNIGKESDWTLKYTNNEEIKDLLYKFWVKKNYHYDNLINKPNRITRLYTNGKVKILLFNIKQKNFENFLGLVKTFKYID